MKWLVVLAAGWAGGWLSHGWLYRPAGAPPVPAASRALESPQVANRAPAPARIAAARGLPAADGVTGMLQAQRYRDAVARLGDRRDPGETDRVRTAILAHLRELLEQQDYNAAGELLSLYLAEDYRDVDALQMRARLEQARGEHGAAIATLYEALSREYRPDAMQRIRLQIRSMVDGRDRQLREAGDYGALLVLYEDLVRLEPDHSPWFLRLAGVQIELKQLEAARQSLALIESDPLVASQVQRLLAGIEDTVVFERGMPVSVPLTRQGSHFIVDGWLNDRVPVRLLIDTGATVTLLKSDILSAAGADVLPTATGRVFNTANGPVRGNVYRVDSLSIGEQRAGNIEIAGLDLPGMEGVDGLLGMNFLGRFRFYIDQEGRQLRLSQPE